MSTQETVTTPSTSNAKDPYFSNAKLALIILVVVGHTWGPMREHNHIIADLYNTLYVFHMPAFVLLCGYFSATFTGSPRQLRRLLTGVLVPYVTFTALYGAMRTWTQEEHGTILLDPYYLTWFLIALFCWRLTAPMWKLIRWPILLATAISFGVLALEIPAAIDLGRILQFLPFFVTGMFLRREHFTALRRPLPRILGVAGVLAVTAMVARFGPEIDPSWFYYNSGAEQLNETLTRAVVTKAVFLAAAAIMIVAFFSLIPNRRLPFTGLGDATMYPFLLHGFFIKAADYRGGWFDIPWVGTDGGAVAVTLAAIALTFLLCSKPVRFLTRPLVEPRLNWLLRVEGPKPEPRRAAATQPSRSHQTVNA